MRKKFLNSRYAPVVSLVIGLVMAAGASVMATSIGTDISVTGDLTVTSGGRIGTGSTGTHITALADDSLLVEGQSEFDGIGWFDAALHASSTLLVGGTSLLYGNVEVNGMATTTAASGNIATEGSITASSTMMISGDVITYATTTIEDNATSTIKLQSSTATTGGCIEFEGADGASTFRLYATTTGFAIFESGTCQ